MDLSSRPAECQEKLSELQKRFDFSEAELVCFELNSGTLSLAKMAAFESFLQVQRDKRAPKKPFLRTDRPLARPLTAGPPFAGDHKRPPSQVTTPINKRTREAAYADDAGTPAPLPMPSHQISVKSSINTGNLEKTSLSQRSEVKLLGPSFWAGEEGHDAYTWMDEAISERAVRRDERLQEWEAIVTATLQRQAEEAVVGTVGVRSQVETILCGRISCEGLEGRLNENSMLLEGSTLAGGAKVQLNVANCQQVAAFPGQIVGVIGQSGMAGSTFHAKEFLPGLPQEAQPLGERSSLHALAVSGPFSKKDVLDFSALESVLAEVASARERPEVLIIFGPLLDSNNTKVAEGEVYLQNTEEPCTFEEVYEELFALLGRHLLPLRQAKPPTEVLIVPALDEVLSFHPLPQPPIDVSIGPFLTRRDSLEQLQRLGVVRFLPNPAHLEINGIKVCLTSADLLGPMLPQLVLRPPGKKIQEALRLLLQQRCLLPMVPREPAQVYESRASALDFPAGAPHLCIFPSISGLSATVADDTLFVNPGFLHKSAMAEVWIAPGSASLDERFRVDMKKLEKKES